jgi:hypothetical protein
MLSRVSYPSYVIRSLHSGRANRGMSAVSVHTTSISMHLIPLNWLILQEEINWDDGDIARLRCILSFIISARFCVGES